MYSIDVTRDGRISRAELRAGLSRLLKLSLKRAEWDEVFDHLDTNRN